MDTLAYGINNSGQIVGLYDGLYGDNRHTPRGFLRDYGFVRDLEACRTYTGKGFLHQRIARPL
jgi:hypothetical protein